MRFFRRTFPAIALGILAITACSDATGPEGVGRASVVLTTDAVAASVIPRVAASIGDVPESAVSSLELAVTRIDLHLVGGDETDGEVSGEGGAWVSLELALTEPVDVLAFAAGGIELAAGTVPVGQYNQARIYFDTSTLTLDQQIVVNALTIDPGTYDVNVPSAAQSGLKLQLAQTSVAGGETETVALTLGTTATIGTLVWNANGFQMNPVIQVN